MSETQTAPRDAHISWLDLRITPSHLNREYAEDTDSARFWRQADTLGLVFIIVCNLAQTPVFQRAAISKLNWLLHWHTLTFSLLALLQLLQLWKSPAWYGRHRHIVMLCMRLSRLVTQLLSYRMLSPSDIYNITLGAAPTENPPKRALSLLGLTPLTQLQQAAACLLPFELLFAVQITSTVLYIVIYLPLQVCTVQLSLGLLKMVQHSCSFWSMILEEPILALAMLPANVREWNGWSACATEREATVAMLLHFLLLFILFIPVGFVYNLELNRKMHFLKKNHYDVACLWCSNQLLRQTVLLAIVAFLPWQLAVAGAMNVQLPPCA